MARPLRAQAFGFSPADREQLSADLKAANWIVSEARDLSGDELENANLLILRDEIDDIPWRDRLAKIEALPSPLPVVLICATPSSPWVSGALRNRRLAAAIPYDFRPGELLNACGSAVEISQLRRDLALEKHLSKSRVAGMSLLAEVTTAATEMDSVTAILDMATRQVARVIRFELCAVLAAIDGVRPVLVVHCAESCDPNMVGLVRDRCLDSYAASTGRLLAEDHLEVTITGQPLRESSANPSPPITTQIPLVAAGHTFGFMFITSPDGQSVTTEARKLLYLLANRLAVILVGLSNRKGNERQRLAMTVDAMADGLLLVRTDGDDVLINPAAREMLDIASDQHVTRSYLKNTLGFYPFDLVTRSEARNFREHVTIGNRVFQSIVSPVRDTHGTLSGVVVALRDHSQAHELEQRQADFVAAVSHELRSPITSITGALDIVLSDHSGRLNDKQRRYAELARDSCTRLSTVIEDLLDVAKVEQTGVVVDLAPALLDELGRECIRRYLPEAEAKGIRLHVSGERSPIRIAGDATKLAQVLNNLLSNAIKFTPNKGTIEVELFGPSVASDHVGVSVFNNGAPIAENDRERVFAKFERTTVDRNVSGTGLGLAISRAIIEAHHGRIWVEPRADGTQFVFTIPAAPNLGETTDGADESSESPPEVSPTTVLLVADEDGASYILKGLIMSDGHLVLVANDADEALSLARAKKPELLVLNLAAADDMLAIARTIKHDPDTRQCAVLAITSDTDHEVLLRSGADEVVTRPIGPNRFRRVCAKLIADTQKVHSSRILLVDDDHNIRSIVREVLENAGYTVHDVPSGTRAQVECQRIRPDLVLMDVTMPGADGFETAEALRTESATSMIPIIFLSARSETADKVRAFRLGAEDYIVKPFVSAELVARVGKALERQERELGASPTTQLPGGGAIEAEFEKRLASGDPYAFVYLDLDNLKAFNDYYGYAKADGIIRQTADLLRDVVARHGAGREFLGHIAGDDFVMSTQEKHVDELCTTMTEAFDRLIPLYYNKGDRERGFIEAEDRFGVRRKFPLMSISICAITVSGSHPANFSELATAAAVGKTQAKALLGSSYVRDGVAVVGTKPPTSTKS